jgi:hypothetical protein
MVLCPQVGRAANFVWAGILLRLAATGSGSRELELAALRRLIAEGRRHLGMAGTNAHLRASN